MTITYRHDGTHITVKIDGKIVGKIKKCAGGWAYTPKGSKQSGEVFKTVAEVRQSLESN